MPAPEVGVGGQQPCRHRKLWLHPGAAGLLSQKNNSPEESERSGRQICRRGKRLHPSSSS